MRGSTESLKSEYRRKKKKITIDCKKFDGVGKNGDKKEEEKNRKKT